MEEYVLTLVPLAPFLIAAELPCKLALPLILVSIDIEGKTASIDIEGRTVPNDIEGRTLSIDIEGRTVPIDMLALSKAKVNQTFLGTDFLEKSGIVLDLKNKIWYFSDKPHHKICFEEDLDVNSLQTAGSVIANSCHLREDESTPQIPKQREKMSYLLKKFDSIFKPGGDPIPYVEHHMNTEKRPPVSVPRTECRL
ncbi:hypothetical protein AVEN_33137-1 [Araneus ventricosus]|uniref:Uncharacterized protein n=1 Tax=Araneus ventricosus TaxID=182803 RepID=A0A4Y2MMM4_ARAVE|nr:hypothetical protein AVEN_33137-1 [Araneus ventricosus]